MNSLAGGETVLVTNASLDSRSLCVLVRGDFETGYAASAKDAEGNSLPVQETGEGMLVHAPDVMVPGLGWTRIHLRRDRQTERPDTAPGASSGRSGEGAFLENEFLRVEAGPDGSLHGVHDKEAEREVLDGRGNQLWAYVDKPREWDAWDVDEDYEMEGEELSIVESIEAVEEGPMRASVRVERRWRDSTIVQTYRLYAGSRRLDVETEVDWRERQVLLRAAFSLNVRSHEATFETMYGAQRRATHRNTSFEAARFEVSAHRFCDLSEPDYGVALLNDGKYGHSVKDNVLGISLLRGPLYPDPRADEGFHAFTYSLFPHPGDWTQGGVVGEAFALNSPLVA
ncbi:MAG: alpha-mannosidase, partial [Actinomycetota bacterium]|nr:alpha-mannosidase [Actinomycetota bacterium]